MAFSYIFFLLCLAKWTSNLKKKYSFAAYFSKPRDNRYVTLHLSGCKDRQEFAYGKIIRRKNYYMQRKICYWEFKKFYCSYSNSFIAASLGVTVECIKKRAYRFGLKKNPAYLSRVRSEIGYRGVTKRWSNEKA